MLFTDSEPMPQKHRNNKSPNWFRITSFFVTVLTKREGVSVISVVSLNNSVGNYKTLLFRPRWGPVPSSYSLSKVLSSLLLSALPVLWSVR